MPHLRHPSRVIHAEVLACRHAGSARDPMKTEWEFFDLMLALVIVLALVVALVVVPWVLM